MAPEQTVRWTSIQPFVFVHLASKEIPWLPASKLDVQATMIVPLMRNVTLFLAVDTPERNVSHFATQAIVPLELTALPVTIERLVFADIL